MLSDRMKKKARLPLTRPTQASDMERAVTAAAAEAAGFPRRRAHATGTPGAYGAEAARADWARATPILPKVPLDEGRRRALRERFAAVARVPEGVPETVATSARTAAAETAARAYEEEWDALLREVTP